GYYITYEELKPNLSVCPSFVLVCYYITYEELKLYKITGSVASQLLLLHYL
ncbi:MAG: hypothetical protein PWR24_1414, partial [Desulfonauticus sp.]|nr:hypothetical protein [Desulfonauticus sp.]